MVLAASVARVHESHRPRFSPSRVFTDARQLPRQSLIRQLIHLERKKLPNTRIERTEDLFKRQPPLRGGPHNCFRVGRRPMRSYRGDRFLIPMRLGCAGVGIAQCDQDAGWWPADAKELTPQFIAQSSGPNSMCIEARDGMRAHASKCCLPGARRADASLRQVSENRLSHNRHSCVCTADEQHERRLILRRWVA